MLKVTVKKGDGHIEMPPIPAGLSGSITENLADSDSVVVFTCKEGDDGALIRRAVQENALDIGYAHVIDGTDLQTIADLEWGEAFELDIHKKYGIITLVLEHIPDDMESVH